MSLKISNPQKRAARRPISVARIVGAAALASANCIASAQVPEAVQAGYVAKTCSQFLQNTGTSSAHEECVTTISAFITGWMKGTRRGVMSATVHLRPKSDKRSNQELLDAVNRMYPDATCLRKTKFKSIAQGFVDYVAANPSRSNESYGDVLADYFLDDLCDR